MRLGYRKIFPIPTFSQFIKEDVMARQITNKILSVFKDDQLYMLSTYSVLMTSFCYFGSDLRISIITANLTFIFSRIAIQIFANK